MCGAAAGNRGVRVLWFLAVTSCARQFFFVKPFQIFWRWPKLSIAFWRKNYYPLSAYSLLLLAFTCCNSSAAYTIPPSMPPRSLVASSAHPIENKLTNHAIFLTKLRFQRMHRRPDAINRQLTWFIPRIFTSVDSIDLGGCADASVITSIDSNVLVGAIPVMSRWAEPAQNLGGESQYWNEQQTYINQPYNIHFIWVIGVGW